MESDQNLSSPYGDTNEEEELKQFEYQIREWEHFLLKIPGVRNPINLFDVDVMIPNVFIETTFVAINTQLPKYQDSLSALEHDYIGLAVFKKGNKASAKITVTTEQYVSPLIDFSDAPIGYEEVTGSWTDIVTLMRKHFEWVVGEFPPVPMG